MSIWGWMRGGARGGGRFKTKYRQLRPEQREADGESRQPARYHHSPSETPPIPISAHDFRQTFENMFFFLKVEIPGADWNVLLHFNIPAKPLPRVHEPSVHSLPLLPPVFAETAGRGERETLGGDPCILTRNKNNNNHRSVRKRRITQKPSVKEAP